jgi:hypothetical protein
MDNEYGWMHATFLTPCDLSAVRPDKEWIENLLRQNPDLTGWPFFVDLWTPRRPEFKPQIIDGIWEARLVSSDDDLKGVDHWRIDAKRGLFYAARALEDDTSPGSPKPGRTLDFSLAILRTAEILFIAVRFASFLCKDDHDTNAKVSLAIKWTGLQGRILSSWANPGRHLSENYQCNTDDVVIKIVEIPFTSSHDQIVLFTQEIVGELFLQFDGWACPSVVVEDLVGRLLNRKL